jgi:hypothetical protein
MLKLELKKVTHIDQCSPSPIRNGNREVSLRHVEKMKNYRNKPFYFEIIVSMTTLF